MKKLFFVPMIALALTACQGIPIPGQGTQPGGVTPPAANYTPPSTPIITQLDTEAQVMVLINELRTKGTLGGDDSVRNGTCAANWRPVPPLTFHGGLHFAARKHADYLAHEFVQTGDVAPSAHVQNNPGNPHFSGRNFDDRIARAFAEHGFAPLSRIGEAVAFNRNARDTVLAWLYSPGHCAAMLHRDFNQGAVGMGSTGGVYSGPYYVAHTWVLKLGR